MEPNYDNIKLNNYNYLVNNYIETIHHLIDSSYNMNILPLKLVLCLKYIKKYISDNKLEILNNGIKYLLTYKDTILNFNITNLDELDEDSDDNMSIKSCVTNIKKSKNIKIESSQDDILNLIIEIKNNSKKLSKENINIIKQYFELLILILENIKSLFF